MTSVGGEEEEELSFDGGKGIGGGGGGKAGGHHIDIRFGSFCRGIRLDVSENSRTKNGMDYVSTESAEGIIAFLKTVSSTKEINGARRIIIVENFDRLPLNSMKWFNRMVERMVLSTWFIFTVTCPSRVDRTLRSSCCVIGRRTDKIAGCNDKMESVDRSNGPRKEKKDKATTTDEMLGKMIARTEKSRTCSDLMTVKIPRCVTALGARDFIKSALWAALRILSSAEKEEGEKTRGAHDLVSKCASYDALQTWSKVKGGISDDDEGFIDTVMMCVLVHVHHVLFARSR